MHGEINACLRETAAGEKAAEAGAEAHERCFADDGLRQTARGRHSCRVGHRRRHRLLGSTAQALQDVNMKFQEWPAAK